MKTDNTIETKKKKTLNSPKLYRLFLFLQFAASVVILFLSINYLPKYELAIAVVALSLFLFISYLLIFAKKSRLLRILGYLFSIAVICVLIKGGIMIHKGTELLIDVTKDSVETVSVSVVALKDGDVKSLSDLEGKVIGYDESYDQNFRKNLATAIKKECGYEPLFDKYSKYKYLADDLYNGKVSAIFFNEAYRPFLEDTYEDFESKTYVLKTFSIEADKEPAATAVADITKDCFVTYISGIDARGEVTAKSRTDANMLVIINPTTHQILLLGIPRDYYVPFHSDGSKDKLTHTGMRGIQESIDTIDDFLGITINYYTRINFSATINIIDALDGVDVYSPVSFSTLDNKYKISKGVNHMEGKKALYFMRSRKMLKGGDNDRVSNQIRVIRALMKKAISVSAIKNFDSVISSVKNSIQTNLTSKEIQNIIQFQLEKKPEWDIQNYQLKGSDLYTYEAHMSKGTRTYVMLPDEDSIKEATSLINKMINNEVISLDKID